MNDNNGKMDTRDLHVCMRTLCVCVCVCVCVCIHVCNYMHSSDFKCRKTSAASILAPEGKTTMNRQEMMMIIIIIIISNSSSSTTTTTTTFITINKMGRGREGQKQTRLRTKWGCRGNKNFIHDAKNHALFNKLVHFLIFTLICYRYSTIVVQFSGMVESWNCMAT